MRIALIEKTEVKRKRLMDVYERNNQSIIDDTVIKESQEMDKLILEYLCMKEALCPRPQA